ETQRKTNGTPPLDRGSHINAFVQGRGPKRNLHVHSEPQAGPRPLQQNVRPRPGKAPSVPVHIVPVLTAFLTLLRSIVSVRLIPAASVSPPSVPLWWGRVPLKVVIMGLSVRRPKIVCPRLALETAAIGVEESLLPFSRPLHSPQILPI